MKDLLFLRTKEVKTELIAYTALFYSHFLQTVIFFRIFVTLILVHYYSLYIFVERVRFKGEMDLY